LKIPLKKKEKVEVAVNDEVGAIPQMVKRAKEKGTGKEVEVEAIAEEEVAAKAEEREIQRCVGSFSMELANLEISADSGIAR
jgi:hypothetical protein